MRKVILLSILIVILASFFASTHPDGLEKVAETLGFIEKGAERASLMTDYTAPFIAQERLSTLTAGIFGVLLIFGLFWGVAAACKQHGVKH